MIIRLVSLCVVLTDQVSKHLISRYCRLGDSIAVIRNFLDITFVQNPGAAFGFMAGTKAAVRIPFFTAITLGAALIVYAYQRFIPSEKKPERFALGLIWGGAMGNFIDRIFRRNVVDFIDVRFYQHHWFPYIFNIADSCITVGLILLIALRYSGKGGVLKTGMKAAVRRP